MRWIDTTIRDLIRWIDTTITTRGGRRPQHANSAQSVTAAVFELRHVDHHGIKTQLVTVVAGRLRVATRGGRTLKVQPRG